MKLTLQTHPESLSDGTPVFVSHCPELDVASQGETEKEALANLCEALHLFLEIADTQEWEWDAILALVPDVPPEPYDEKGDTQRILQRPKEEGDIPLEDIKRAVEKVAKQRDQKEEKPAE